MKNLKYYLLVALLIFLTLLSCILIAPSRIALIKQAIVISNIITPFDIKATGVNSKRIDDISFSKIEVLYQGDKTVELNNLDINFKFKGNKKLFLNLGHIKFFHNTKNSQPLKLNDIKLGYSELFNYASFIDLLNLEIEKVSLLDSDNNVTYTGNVSFKDNLKNENNKRFLFNFNSVNKDVSIKVISDLYTNENQHVFLSSLAEFQHNNNFINVDFRGGLNLDLESIEINAFNLNINKRKILELAGNINKNKTSVNLNIKKHSLNFLIPDDISKHIKDLSLEGNLYFDIDSTKINARGELIIFSKANKLSIIISSNNNKILFKFKDTNKELGEITSTYIKTARQNLGMVETIFSLDNSIVTNYIKNNSIIFNGGSTSGAMTFDLDNSKITKADLNSSIKKIQINQLTATESSYFDIKAKLNILNNQLKLSEFSAFNKKGGNIKGSGITSFGLTPTHNYNFYINKFYIFYKDVVNSEVSGAIELKSLNEGLNIEGKLFASKGLLSLQNFKNFSNIPKLNIIEKHEKTDMPSIILNMSIEAEEAFLVKSSNLKALLIGSVGLNGELHNLNVTSNIKVQKGNFLFFNKNFIIQKAQLFSSNKTIYIILNALYKDENHSYTLSAQGPIGSELEINLSSNPPQTSDVIFSSLIFNKDIKTLSPYELFTLTQYITNFQGGGIMEKYSPSKIVKKFGIDSIDFSKDNNNTYTYSLKKKLNNKTVIGYDGSISNDNDRFFYIETNIFNDLSLFIKSGNASENKFGMKYEIDY